MLVGREAGCQRWFLLSHGTSCEWVMSRSSLPQPSLTKPTRRGLSQGEVLPEAIEVSLDEPHGETSVA